MLKKQRKWLSWALVVALLLSLLPTNVQPAQAATYTNPTLEAAVNTIPTKNLPVVSLANKNIVGEVDLNQLKGTDPNQFPNLVRVNLSGNYITNVLSYTGSGTPVTVLLTDGLFDSTTPSNPSARAQLKLSSTLNDTANPITRKKNAATDIPLTELWEDIVLADGSKTLKELATMGLLDRIEMEYKLTGAAAPTQVAITSAADVTSGNVKIPQADVGNLDESYKIKVKVWYKNITTPTNPVERSVKLLVPTLKVTGIVDNSTLYRGVSKVNVTVQKIDEDGNPMDIAAATDIGLVSDPVGQASVVPGSDKLLDNSGAVVTANGKKYTATLEVPTSAVVTPAGGPLTKIKATATGFTDVVYEVKIADANFTTFQLVELRKNPADGTDMAGTQDSHFFPAYLGTGAGGTAPGLYMFANSSLASFNQAQYDKMKETSGSTGKFYIKIPEGSGYRFLRADEKELIKVYRPGDSLTGGTNVDKGYDYQIATDANGRLYLTFSSSLTSEGGNDKQYTISLNTNTAPKPKLTVQGVTLAKIEPTGFYVYEFDKESSDDGTIAARISDNDTNDVYYIANNRPLTPQDYEKMTKPINLIEGQEKVLIPVASYGTRPNDTRQAITTSTIQKSWYQKEDNSPSRNFTTAETPIRGVASVSYPLDADGYPVPSGGTLTPYKGAPITAYLPSTGNLPAYGSLIVSGKSMPSPAKDKFANIVLSLAGTNNPVGFWLQVNWAPKKVSSYVLVPDTFNFPQDATSQDIKNLDSFYDITSGTASNLPAGVTASTGMTFKDQLEAWMKEVDQLPHPLTKPSGTKAYKINDTQKVAVPIGETKQYKILAIYDNGNVDLFSGSPSDKTQIIGQTGFQNGDIVIDSSAALGTGVVKFIGTDHAGFKEVGGRYTDGRSGAKADYQVKDSNVKIAELQLAPSVIQNVVYVANDNRMLGIDLDNPLKTGKITTDTWKGNTTLAGLPQLSAGNDIDVYVGNSSYNEELEARVYLIPVYSNKDLNLSDVLNDQTGNKTFETKLNQFAWDPTQWTPQAARAVGLNPVGGSLVAATTGDTGHMPRLDAAAGLTPVNLNLADTIKEFNNHEVKGTVNRTQTLNFKIQPAIYDRMGAIQEVDLGSGDYKRVEVDPTKIIEVGSTPATAATIRTRYTNSNLFGVQSLGYNKGEFDYGVYFYGSGAISGSLLDQPSAPGPTTGPTGNELTGDVKQFKDLAMLTYLSGLGLNNTTKPATYATAILAGGNPYNTAAGVATARAAILAQEAQKIEHKVYKKEGTTFVDATAELNINSPHPGTYQISGNQRGTYYVVFNAKNGYNADKPKTPIVRALPDKTKANQLVAADTDDLKNYKSGADVFYLTIGVNSAELGAIYNYVREDVAADTNNQVTLNNGDVVVNIADNNSTNLVNFDVYPIVIDKWFLDKYFPGGAPAKLDDAAKATIKNATGQTVEQLLTTPYSGVSYMTTTDFKFNDMGAANWNAGNSPLITAAGVATENLTLANGNQTKIIKQEVRVDKGRLNNNDLGLKAAPGEFNGAGSLIASPSGFTPSTATAFDIAPVKVKQSVDAVLQDIVVTPADGVEINTGETAKFTVQYRTDDNALVPVTADNLNDANSAAHHYLKVEQLSGPTGATLVKQAPVGSNPAELQFTATEIGTYKYKLQTTNIRGANVPNLQDGKVISFTVVPSIRSNYELWVGDELTVDLGSDLSLADIELEPTPNNVLDPAKLAQGKLAIDPNWPNIGNPTNQIETVEVKLKKDGDYLGTLKFDVVCHPRGNATYSIEPVTIFDDNETHVSPAGPVELDRDTNTSFLVRVKKTYDDGTFEYVDATDINLTNQGIYDANGTTDTNDFLTFAPSGDKAVKATLSSTLPVDTETWYGLWEATIDGQTLQLHVRLNKAGDAADPRPAVSYKIYELNGNDLQDVTDNPGITFKLNERERYLFIVDEANAGAPVIAEDASISLDNNSTLNYRLMSGATTTIAGGNTNDLKNNPTNYTRIRISPKATGTVAISATDTYQANTVAVTYKVIDPANALKARISGEPTAPVAKGTAVTLTANAVGGNDPGSYTYQWQESNDGNNWIDIAGETNQTLPVATSALGTHFYRVVVTKGSEVANSPSASVTVVAATPTPSTVTAAFVTNPVSANLGGTASFNVVVSGAQPTDTITYEWTAKNPANNVVTALTETSDTLTLSNLTAADMAQEYYVKVKVNGAVVTTVGPGTLAQGLINITFNLGDGTVVDPSGAAVSTVVKAYAANQVIASSDVPVPTPAAGKTFVGWAPADPANHTVVAPKTFTAVYNTSTAPAGQSEIKFYVGNGTITSGNATLYKPNGATIAASEVPTVTAPAGYKFNGWDVDPVSSGYIVNGNKTFVAQYRALNNYQVTFVLGQGIHVSGSPALVQTIQEDHVIQANEVPGVQAPAAANFTGWSPSNPVGHKVVGNITFTATFTTTGGGGGGGGGGGAIVPPTPTPTPTPTPSTSTTTKPAELPPVELDQNYKFAYIHGYPGQVVRASGAITRAEVAAIFSRLLKEKMDESKTYTSSFSDIKAGKWYSNPIGYLEGFKIISGYQDGTFKPDKQLTRAEFASVISRFAKLDTTKKTNFSDVSSNHWAKDYIDNAISHGWMGGYPDGTFKPNQPITRAEIVTVINKLINRTPDKAAIDGNSANATRFKDLSKTYWAYYDVIEASTDR